MFRLSCLYYFWQWLAPASGDTSAALHRTLAFPSEGVAPGLLTAPSVTQSPTFHSLQPTLTPLGEPSDDSDSIFQDESATPVVPQRQGTLFHAPFYPREKRPKPVAPPKIGTLQWFLIYQPYTWEVIKLALSYVESTLVDSPWPPLNLDAITWYLKVGTAMQMQVSLGESIRKLRP